MKKVLLISVFFINYLFASWSQTLCNDLKTDGYYTANSIQDYDKATSSMYVDGSWVYPGASFYNCNGGEPETSQTYTIYTAESGSDSSTFHGTRQSFSYNSGSCPSGTVLDSSSLTCQAPACTPLSEYTVNIPKSDCQGNIQDTNNQVSGILSWQDCDNTCYITESVPLTCEELRFLFRKSCDTSKNNFSFSCSDINGVAVIDTSKTFCKPKSNPCDDMYDIKITQCSDSQVLIGYPECRHNGNNVINPEVFKCVDNNSSENPKNQQPWDCIPAFNKIWDDSTKSCDCMDGYELSFYGSCKKILDSNATSEQIDNANNEAKNNSKEKQKEDFDRNNTLESNRHLSNIENILSSVSNDLNQSKSFLGSIKGLIGKIVDSFDGNNSGLPSIDMESNLDDLKSNYSDLKSSIESLQNLLKNGLVNPIPSGSGGSCAYNNVISGNGMSIPVNINPCVVVAPYYSTLYKIWYFLFFALFLVATFKIIVMTRED